MSTESAGSPEAEFQGVELVAIDLARSEPPGKKILELSAMEIARSDQPPLGGVVFLLDREPPDGWQECLHVAETELGYEGPYVSKLNGRSLELNYDPSRFDERFTGLKVAVANANEQYRQLLAERAEQRRRVEEAEAEYRAHIAAAAERLGIRTVSE
jgi:hypothetical protein